MATRSASVTDFGACVGEAYATGGSAIELGLGIHEGAVAPEAGVRVPLRMMNRHGLIAGATAEATGGGADAIGDFLKSSTGRTIQRELVRGLFGQLKKRV